MFTDDQGVRHPSKPGQPWVKGDGMQANIDWLEKELPPSVFELIAFVVPAGGGHGRQRCIEIGFWRENCPTVVVRRRKFRKPETIARICLEAP